MEIVRLIGILFFIFGINTVWAWNSIKKYKETGKGGYYARWYLEHDKNPLPKPLAIGAMIVGVIIIFGTNFHANVTVGDDVVYEYNSNDDAEQIAVDKKNDNFSETDSKKVVDSDEVSNETQDINIVDDTTNAGYLLKFGSAQLNIPEITGYTCDNSYDGYVLRYVSDDSDYNQVVYSDSSIATDDTDAINEYVSTHGTLLDSVEYQGRKVYICYNSFGDGFANVYVLQDIGMGSMLEIKAEQSLDHEITEYDIVSIAESFALTM